MGLVIGRSTLLQGYVSIFHYFRNHTTVKYMFSSRDTVKYFSNNRTDLPGWRDFFGTGMHHEQPPLSCVAGVAAYFRYLVRGVVRFLLFLVI